MWSTRFGLVLVLCCVLASAKIKEAKIEKIELSPGSEAVLTLEHSIEQLNSTTFAVTAHYVQKVELDNSYLVQIIFSMGTRGDRYMEVYRTKAEGLCDFIKSGSAKLKMNVPGDMEICPIPPMDFTLEREEFNVEPLLSMGMPGKFKADIILSQGGAEKVKATAIIEMK